MNPTATATPTAPIAPPGGFQLGGWYQGRQWNGSSFTQPAGVEAIGANTGKAVNPTVVAATNVQQGLKPGTNEAYIAAQNGGLATGVPGATGTATDATTDPYNTPDILAAQKELTDRQTAYNVAIKNENDNPFYSESTLTGKLAKINQAYNADTSVLQNKLKMLQSNADNQARATAAQNKTTIKTFTDNNGNVTSTVLDSQGNVVKKTDLGKVGKATKTAAGKTTAPKLTATDKAVLKEQLASDTKNGFTLNEIVDHYKAFGLDVPTIYNLYNKSGSPYGPAVETLQNVVSGKYSTQSAQ